MGNPSKGVYFLCNDRLIELAIAFLNAFRARNPGLPLCLLPYKDDDVARLKELAGVYNFTIFPDREKLKLCDEIGSRIKPAVADARFRKLAIWDGIFDEFIYIDVDNLVFEDLSYLFGLLEDYDFVTSDSHYEGNIRFVWKTSIYEADKLSLDQIKFAANTSFILSKKGALNLALVRAALPAIDELIPHMELICGEQPLLNYLIVTSGRPHSSLLRLKSTGEKPDIGVGTWAGSLSKDQALSLRHGSLKNDESLERLAFVHWSGKWQPPKRDKLIFHLLRPLGLKIRNPIPRYFMTHAGLWKSYRDLQP